MRTATYRKIDRDNINPAVNAPKLMEERNLFIKHQKLFSDMRRAYGKGRITRQELLTLRGQIKAGDAAVAKMGLMRLLERDCVI